jgi:serine/threonine-protein kinase RsbW
MTLASLVSDWPKFRMELVDMAQTHTRALQPCNSDCEPFVESQQCLPSQMQAISPFLDQLMRFILRFRNADGSETDIEMAVREALANAVIHGNGECPDKHVYVVCRCWMDGEVSIAVRDQGPGFDSETVPDPTAPEYRLLPHGRGIYLMKNLMDEVSFEDSGTVVRMRKKSNADSAKQRRLE